MPALRGLRGSVVGFSAAGLGLAGHTLAGGMLPPVQVVAVATVGLVLLGIAMSGRTWGLAPLLSVLVGAQGALHLVLAGAAPAAHTMPGMAHGGPMAGPVMTAAHLGAAVVTALLLRRGELWCQALVALLTRPVRALSLTTLPLPWARRLPIHPGPVRQATPLLAPSLSRRGPPAFSLA